MVDGDDHNHDSRHDNGVRTRGARPGPAPILTGKIRVDRGRVSPIAKIGFGVGDVIINTHPEFAPKPFR